LSPNSSPKYILIHVTFTTQDFVYSGWKCQWSSSEHTHRLHLLILRWISPCRQNWSRT